MYTVSTPLGQQGAVLLGLLDDPIWPSSTVPGVLGSPAHIEDDKEMTTAAINANTIDETLVPYTILGALLGLLPVFSALVITRLAF